jgi:hypothetical protein
MSEYDPTADDSENPHSIGYLAIRIAEVIEVNHEDMNVFLRIKNGSESNRTPIPISFPCIGNRMFLGGMPQIGDFAVVGWTMEGGSKRPVVLNWIGAGLSMGKDWMMSQPFEQDQYDMNDERAKFFEGAYNRVRHKLRSMNSGDILASSSSGSDLILDESVLLTNRRGNEIHIRDADQSIVTQSVNLFNVQAGVRSYSGVVQRDSFSLPTQMFSDGNDWSGYSLFDSDFRVLALQESEAELGILTPNDIFEVDGDGNLNTDLFSEDLNPFKFLQSLGMIDEDYIQVYPFDNDPSVYGGKSFYRINNELEENLTEHRIELTHTSDGTLPMSEQTDVGVDPETEMPFIEQVMGTVISNDRSDPDLYGKPLTAKIFPKPTLIDASKKDISEHLAYLTRITPPIEKPNIDPTPYMFAVGKNGRAFLNVTGRRNGDKDFAAEVRFGSGIQIELGSNSQKVSFLSKSEGAFQVQAGGNGEKNVGVSLIAQDSGIEIKGEGLINEPSQFDDPDNLPLSVLIQGTRNVGISSNESIVFSATNGVVFTELSKFAVSPKDTFEVNTDQVSVNSKTVNKIVTGQEQTSFSGPKDGLPSNYPLRETSLTTTIPSPTANIDEYNILAGRQTKTIKTGGSFRQRILGNGKITNSVTTGSIKNTVGASNMTLNNSNLNTTVPKTLKVLAGASIKMTATGKVTIKSGGIAKIQGSVVQLKATGGTTGGILCSGSINPLTGLPFSASGLLGSPTHRLK